MSNSSGYYQDATPGTTIGQLDMGSVYIKVKNLRWLSFECGEPK